MAELTVQERADKFDEGMTDLLKELVPPDDPKALECLMALSSVYLIHLAGCMYLISELTKVNGEEVLEEYRHALGQHFHQASRVIQNERMN